MRVLALDIATNVGVAVGCANGAPAAFSVHLGKGPEARRFSRVHELTGALIEEHKPDLVAMEAAIGGPKASHYLIGLVACVSAAAWARGLEPQTCYLASIRKHFLGKALNVADFPGMSKSGAKAAIKEEVIKRCNLLGWKPLDDDEADAMALWDFAQSKFARGYQSAPLGGLFGER